jgi:hypothetical protein
MRRLCPTFQRLPLFSSPGIVKEAIEIWPYPDNFNIHTGPQSESIIRKNEQQATWIVTG